MQLPLCRLINDLYCIITIHNIKSINYISSDKFEKIKIFVCPPTLQLSALFVSSHKSDVAFNLLPPRSFGLIINISSSANDDAPAWFQILTLNPSGWWFQASSERTHCFLLLLFVYFWLYIVFLELSTIYLNKKNIFTLNDESIGERL